MNSDEDSLWLQLCLEENFLEKEVKTEWGVPELVTCDIQAHMGLLTGDGDVHKQGVADCSCLHQLGRWGICLACATSRVGQSTLHCCESGSLAPDAESRAQAVTWCHRVLSEVLLHLKQKLFPWLSLSFLLNSLSVLKHFQGKRKERGESEKRREK